MRLLLVCLAILSPAVSGAGEAWLRWRNGDELKGEILPGKEGRIRWKSSAFAEPFSLRYEPLESVRFPSPAKTDQGKTSSEFRIVMRNGDRLEGALLSLSPETVAIDCPPFAGPVSIRREEIERIVNLRNGSLRYTGPDELTDWSSTGRDRKTSEWFTDLQGAFATHQWSGNLFRAIAFPNAVEIEFRADFPLGGPNLEIGFLREPDGGPRIETWDDHLVLTHGSRFVPIMALDESTDRLDFRLFWNQENGDLRLCRLDGSVIASLDDVKVERPSGTSSSNRLDRGFSILNRNAEMRLESLVVQDWDGAAVPVIDLEKPRLVLAGAPPRSNVDGLHLSPDRESLVGVGSPVPLDDVLEVVLAPGQGRPEESRDSGETTRAAWFGGTTVSGELLGLAPSTVTLSPSWSDEPVQVSLANAREIRFPETPGFAPRSRDRLEGEGFALRGTLRPLTESTDSRLLGWEAPGADQPVPLAEGAEASATRGAFGATGVNPIGQGRVYLTNHEVLAGSIVSMTTELVYFNSRVTGVREIPTEHILAVDIGGAGRVLEGFGDSEWEEVESSEEQVAVEGDTVTLRDGSFGNPSLLVGDRVRFRTQWEESYGAVTLRLFADGAETGSPSTDIILAAQGNRLFVGKLKESGAFSFSGDQIPLEGNEASFEIEIEPEKVHVKVDGRTSLTLQVDPEQVSGNGIYFRMGGGWQGWNQNGNEIQISEFAVERTPGSLPRRIVDPQAKQNALLVPRGDRDPLPTHLLVAPNGDLLRGFLRAASGDSIRFTAGDETFDLPRHRVSAVVWLSPPKPGSEEDATEQEGSAEDPEAEEKSERTPFADYLVTHQFTLMDGSHLRLRADRIDQDRFVGHSAVLGECSIAIENIRTMRETPATPAGKLVSPAAASFAGWRLALTPDPAIPGGGGDAPSPLIGKPAPPLKLPAPGNEIFDLADAKGSVVVLDFWATWCGPCIRAIPEIRSAVEAFPPGMVVFRAVNQAETASIVTSFLEAREWSDLPVLLDFDLTTSSAFGVEGIPHTVVIGKDGNIAWVHSGFSEDLKEKLFEAIATALQQ